MTTNTTNTNQQVTQSETLEQIAERIAGERFAGYDERTRTNKRAQAILCALHNERERAIQIINDHQAQDVCKDNCWTTIKAAIKEGR